MSDTGSWTGWKSNDSGRSAYCIGLHNHQTLGSTGVGYAKVTDYVDCTDVERITVQLVSAYDSVGSIKFYTTEMASPNTTFNSAEWDQEPDTSTIYSLGSNSRLKKSLVGPIRWLACTGSVASTSTNGSLTVTYHLLA